MGPGTTDLRLYCFGGFNLVTNNTAINLGSRKANALFIYLAIESPQSFSRSHLAGLLWSDFSEDRARQNLRQTMLRMHKATSEILGDKPLLIPMRDQITINPQINLWVDVLAFENLLSQAYQYFNDHNRFERLDIQALLAAITLFKSAFLNRFYIKDSILFNEWASLVRERTNRKAIEAATLLCRYYQQRGDFVQAGHIADKIMSLNPWDQQICVHCMRLCAAQKQWGAAKQYYIQIKNYLRKNLNLEPDPRVIALYDQIRESSLKNEPLSFEEPPIRTNLPEFSSSFIGRDKEISDLSMLLANPKNRLISLIGMGGIGKTRLAIRIGHIMHGLYKHGVFFIPLRDINAFPSLLNLLSESLGLALSDTSTQRDQIVRFLTNKQCLFILDNFEHLILQQEFIDFLMDLFEKTKNVKVLITSRDPVNLHEEHVYPLTGLTCSPSEVAAIQSLPNSDALSLFEERARQVNYQFKLTEKITSAVDKLCSLVEGHPLSIELMASTVPYQSTSDILAELQSNLLTLQSPYANTPKEHRSLPVVLERSWRLLSEDQKLTLCKMACFSGNFSIEAAINIAQTTKDNLSSLVLKSLIRTSDFSRYDLHEIIHQFACAKSKESKLLDTAMQAHAKYFVALLERAGELFQDGHQKRALDLIEQDIENIHTAWVYLIETQAIDKLINSIDILYKFYNIRSKFEEGFALFLKTLSAAQGLDGQNLLLGMVLNRLGALAHRAYHNNHALEYFQRSQSIFEINGNHLELGLSYLGLGNYYLRVKDLEKAIHFASQSLACFQSINNAYQQGPAYYLLGIIYLRMADFRHAEKVFLKSLEIARKNGDQRGIFLRLNALAGIACNDGDFDRAEKFYTESLALCRSFKDQFNEAIVLNNLASVYHPRRQYDREEVILKESLDICREIGDQEGEAIALNNLGELALVQGDIPGAFNYSRPALNIATRLKDDWTVIAAYDILGCAYLASEDIPSATQCFVHAIQKAYKIHSWDLLTRSTINIAQVFIQKGESAIAKSLLEAAVGHPGILYEYNLKARDLLQEMGVHPSDEKNEKLILDALERHLNLKTSN